MIEQSKSDTGFEIMPASEARKKTEEILQSIPHKEEMLILDVVNTSISKAVEKGEYFCVVQLTKKLYRHIDIKETLRRLYGKNGYKIDELFAGTMNGDWNWRDFREFKISWM